MIAAAMPGLALLLFAPWFLLLAALYWHFPRQPRGVRRKAFDLVALALALALSYAGMRLGYALGAADLASGAIWKQVLATLVAYGAFLMALAVAVPLRGWWLRAKP